MTYYQPLRATRRPVYDPEDPGSIPRYCDRCGYEFPYGTRKTTVTCKDCRFSLAAEKQAERAGVDLTVLADDEWFTDRGHVRKVAA